MSCKTVRFFLFLTVIYTISCSIYIWLSKQTIVEHLIAEEEFKITIDSKILYSLNINPQVDNLDGYQTVRFVNNIIAFKSLDRVISTDVENLMIFISDSVYCVIIIDNYHSSMAGVINEILNKISNQFKTNLFIFVNQQNELDFRTDEYRDVRIYGSVSFKDAIIPQMNGVIVLDEPIIIPSAPIEQQQVYASENIHIYSNYKNKEPPIQSWLKMFKRSN